MITLKDLRTEGLFVILELLMDSNTAALKAYIGTQRENGISDDMIYQTLLSSGWQREAIIQAFSAQSAAAVERIEMPIPEASLVESYSSKDAVVKKRIYDGRLSRIGFFMAHIYILAYFIMAILVVIMGHGSSVVNVIGFLLGGLGVLGILILPFFFYARRWHDINQSGWLSLLNLIPGAALPIMIILLILPGTRDANKYGSNHQRSLSPMAVYGFGD